MTSQSPQPSFPAYGTLQGAIDRLGQTLAELAAALQPFPFFYGSEVIRALEIDTPEGYPDRGCVVFCPDGRFYELDIGLIPAPTDVGGVDGVELFRDLDLPPQEYFAYASLAMRAVVARLTAQGLVPDH
ncbi:MAG: hypothetical protein FJ315_00475 [SAR202 cluster bacterium]|nr:hypothetical protein [SAR202 cluster bacterium]